MAVLLAPVSVYSLYAMSPRSWLAMFLTDLNGPTSAQPPFRGVGGISLPARLTASLGHLTALGASAILFLMSMTFGAAISRAQSQDVAEAARQARARKQGQQKSKKHVYTNEDLSRAKILTLEDQAQLEAKKNECAKKNNCSPAEKSQDALDANSRKPGTSLGEVARQYRKHKEQQKELEALKPKPSEPFHLPSEPALASPILPARPAVRRPAAPVLRPGTSSHVMRRDPFSRVLTQPTRPEIRPGVRSEIRGEAKPSFTADFFADVRPTFGRSAHGKFPRGPKVSSQRTPLSIWVEPARPSAPVVPAEPIANASSAASPVAAAQPNSCTPKKFVASKNPVAPMEAIRPARPARILPSAPTTSEKTINVRRGDSLWKVAQQNLGSGSRWPELLAANPWIANPSQIPAGAQLALPVVAAKTVSTPSGKSRPPQVTVRKGSTMWSMAKANLGRWSAWPCLAAANPGLADPNRIYEGQELLLPTGCADSSGNALRPDEK